MMNIIEKLGIEPLKQYYNRILDLDIFSTHEIRAVESQRNELLEALIEIGNTTEDFDDAIYSAQKIVSKNFDIPWDKIKDLL